MSQDAMTATGTVNVPDLIDEQKVGSFQIRILVLCALAALLDGFAAQMIGYVAPSIAREMHLGPAALTPIFVWGLVGLMLGALAFGPIADRFGRKPVIVACTLFYGLITLATTKADSGVALAVFRFLAGLGFGGVMPNAIALTAEYSPHRRRGTMVTIMFCGFPVGASLAGFVTVPILNAFSWRGVFVLAGAMPLLLAPALLVWLPESIRHLIIHRGRESRVRDLLLRINSHLAFGAEASFVIREERASGIPVFHLFRQGRAVATVLLWIGFFMSLLEIYFLASWLPTVFHGAGITLSLAVIATAVLQGGGVVASLLLGLFVDRFGAFRSLTFTFFLGAVFVALLGYTHSVALILVCTFFAGVGIIGGQTGANALASSFYPTYIRSTGVGWALGVGRIGSLVGPILGGRMLAMQLPLTTIFLVGAVPSLIGSAAIFLMGRTQISANAKSALGMAAS